MLAKQIDASIKLFFSFFTKFTFSRKIIFLFSFVSIIEPHQHPHDDDTHAWHSPTQQSSCRTCKLSWGACSLHHGHVTLALGPRAKGCSAVCTARASWKKWQCREASSITRNCGIDTKWIQLRQLAKETLWLTKRAVNFYFEICVVFVQETEESHNN